MITQTLRNARKRTSCVPARLKKSAHIIKNEKLDAFLLSFTPNVSYICGFHAPDSFLILEKDKAALITDSRYAADFKRKTHPAIEVIELKKSIFHSIVRTAKKQSIKKIGFESRHLTFAECQILRELADTAIKFIPLKTTIEPLREIKEEEEMQSIKKAVEITQKTFGFIQKILKPGIKETEITAEIERYIRLQGASKTAFDTIVASGPNASFPHANVSDRVIQNGEPVIIDLGVEYAGYKCDLTRTFFLGKINPSVRKAYTVICQAQRRAISKIRHGSRIKDIDLAARNYIKQKGFAKFFIHSLGHGVGLEIHESPSINRKNTGRLRKGMVITIEPGIYVAGEFGIRIEDMIIVEYNGSEVISGNDKY